MVPDLVVVAGSAQLDLSDALLCRTDGALAVLEEDEPLGGDGVVGVEGAAHADDILMPQSPCHILVLCTDDIKELL